MSIINYAKKEISFKIVYYGAGVVGKTVNLQYLHRSLPDDSRGNLTSLATGGERTLFFDFLPVSTLSGCRAAPEERQALLESARVCEMILEANPADTGALETLKEIHTRLGDRDKLRQVVSTLAGFSGVRASVGVAASKADEVGEPTEPAAAPVRSPGPTPEWRMARLGDRLIAEGLVTPEQLAKALAAQKGTHDKLGSTLVRLGILAEERLLDFLSRQHNVPAITLSQLDIIDPDVLRLDSRTARREARGAADQALRQYADPGHGGSRPTCSPSTTWRS